MIIAPVWQAGKTEWSTYLTEGAEWTNVWSGKTFAGGRDATVGAPFGEPPVFYRTGSEFAELFAGLRKL